MRTRMLFLLPFLFSSCVSQKSPTVPPKVPMMGFVKSGTIHVDDHSLADWKQIDSVRSLTCVNQWQDLICEKAPDSCRSDQVDLEASFYFAWDGANLFFAVNVVDDSIVSVPSTDEYLYRGDSAELFFVVECESVSDYHDCVRNDKPVFQMLLCPNELENKKYHLAEYRTPESIIQSALDNGFHASGWKTKSGWQAEAAFPLTALDKTKSNNWSGKRVKVSFDILDYDRHLAERKPPCWGFEPNHVISNVEKKEMATNPTQMTEFMFEGSK